LAAIAAVRFSITSSMASRKILATMPGSCGSQIVALFQGASVWLAFTLLRWRHSSRSSQLFSFSYSFSTFSFIEHWTFIVAAH